MRSLAELLPPPGDDVCIYAPDGEWTRSRLRERVEELMVDLATEPNTAVGVTLPNRGESIASMFAVWRAGAVLVPINPRLTATERARIHQEVVGTSYDADVAIVSFTSGTTGAPKPVPLAHGRILEGFEQVLTTLRSAPSTRPPMPNLVPVPLALWAGIYQVLFAFTVGAPVIVMDKFDTVEFAKLVRHFEIRSSVLPPAAMVMLVDDERIADLSPLRYVRSISSPLSPLQARRFRDRFGIRVLNGYGQTELGGEVVGWGAADSKTYGDAKLGAVGRPHPGVDVRIDDETGELLVRIPGRLDDWQHTGDIARIDEDGFAWIEGRVSDMINRGGLKVHPGEVEEVLRLSPSLTDAAVVGVPDDRLGEVPVAFVVETQPVSDEALAELCRTHLAPYKVPVRFERVDALPRNEVGEVLKRALCDPPST
jgi:acyl-CoA synthetase (AMP-forming)/AMP-acid ligase II